ncbi:MAG: hypothetical protein C0434_07860 [Xanthomonadaceae bacterium]|nr:hypothetical protein [Xanthomonadaceae bacterium]
MSELHDKALLTLRDKASMYCNHPTASKPAKAIIRDLLAENERLANELAVSEGAIEHWKTECDIEEVENEELIKQLAEEQNKRHALLTRAVAAESRLRELCEMKAVAWVGLDGEVTPACSSDSYFADSMIGWQALIPRPEMPK